jgi:ribosomal protein L13
MSEVVAKKGFKEVFERAVYGMLPKNKLTKAMMKNLNITE